MSDSPFALNSDGSAKDPIAFQRAIRNDSDKMAALQGEPDTLRVLLSEDLQAVQNLLRSTFKVCIVHGRSGTVT